jgi:protein-L-isoaspartate O-methyltransferase
MDFWNTFFLVVFVGAVFSIFPVLFRGAVYLPTHKRTVGKMIELAEVKSGDVAVDLGSGDGRLVIALAKAGAEAHGYEINPLLVFLARKKIRKAGLQNKAFIHLKNFWKEDFSRFNIITIFGISFAMEPLEKKFKKELKTGTRIISNVYTFPNWQYEKKEDTAFLYRKL